MHHDPAKGAPSSAEGARTPAEAASRTEPETRNRPPGIPDGLFRGTAAETTVSSER